VETQTRSVWHLRPACRLSAVRIAQYVESIPQYGRIPAPRCRRCVGELVTEPRSVPDEEDPSPAGIEPRQEGAPGTPGADARSLRRRFEHTRPRPTRAREVLGLVTARGWAVLVRQAKAKLGAHHRHAEDIVQQALQVVLANPRFDPDHDVEKVMAFVSQQVGWQVAEFFKRRQPDLLGDAAEETDVHAFGVAATADPADEVLAEGFLRDVLDRVGLTDTERAIFERLLSSPGMSMQDMAVAEDPARDGESAKTRATSLRQAKVRAIKRFRTAVGWTKEEADVLKTVYVEGLAGGAETAGPALAPDEFEKVYVSAVRKLQVFLYRDGTDVS
jgi:hypothetical protein